MQCGLEGAEPCQHPALDQVPAEDAEEDEQHAGGHQVAQRDTRLRPDRFPVANCRADAELAAAVSNQGGLGGIGSLFRTTAAIMRDIEVVKGWDYPALLDLIFESDHVISW